MVNVVIFTPDTHPIGKIPAPELPYIAQNSNFYKEHFSGLVEMTLDDITWKRILSMDIAKIPSFIQELLRQHNERADEILSENQVLYAA